MSSANFTYFPSNENFFSNNNKSQMFVDDEKSDKTAEQAAFLFSQPFKSHHQQQNLINYEMVVKKLLLNNKEIRFELARPVQPSLLNKIDLAKITKETSKSGKIAPGQRTHVVVVEQAPFSVLKSVRAQEQAQKVRIFRRIKFFK